MSDHVVEKLNSTELKRYRQKKKVLTLLYKYGSLPGTSIGSRMGVSLPTAIALINELIEKKLIESCGHGASRGGRKPVMYRLAAGSFNVIACELGRYKARIVIYDAHNKAVSAVSTIETNIDDNELSDKIYAASQDLIRKNNIDPQRIYGVGVTMPGLIDGTNGINHTIKDPEFRNIKEHLEQKFQKKVSINNDARMQAYGEYIFGKAKGHPNALIINWSWGIGLGMIFDGKLYNGAIGFAGELSHTKFVEDGDLCICGKRGCLETIASSNYLIKMGKAAIEQGTVSQLTQRFSGRANELRPEDVIEAAKLGDEFSISLLSQVGKALGAGLAFSIQLLNPEIIVLGGVISEAGRFILAPIQQALNKHCIEQISSNVKIVISENWQQAGLLGITATLFQQLFSDTNSELKVEFV